MGPSVVDFHVHLFPPEVVADREAFRAHDPFFGALYANPRSRIATAEDALASMDRNGVELAVALGWGWHDPALCAAHNDYLADVVRRFPGRFVGFASVNPRVPGAGAEIERAVSIGLRGVGELMPHGQGWSLDDDRMVGPVAEVARALDLIVLTHTSEPVGHDYPGKGNVYPPTILKFLRSWPGMRVVLAHWGGGLPFYELMPEVAELTRDTWYDSAATPFLYDPAVFEVVVRCAGAHRIVFGSDFPLIRQGPLIRKVRDAGLKSDQIAAILSGNARRLLGIKNQNEEEDACNGCPDRSRSSPAVPRESAEQPPDD